MLLLLYPLFPHSSSLLFTQHTQPLFLRVFPTSSHAPSHQVHHGGLCNIQYDDGEAETKVSTHTHFTTDLIHHLNLDASHRSRDQVHPSMIRKPGEVLPVMASASNEDDEWTDGDEDDDDLDEEDDGWELVHRPKVSKYSIQKHAMLIRSRYPPPPSHTHSQPKPPRQRRRTSARQWRTI